MQRHRKYTAEQLETAVASGGNLHTILKALGLVPRGGNYESVRRQIARLGLDAPQLDGLRARARGSTDVAVTDDEIVTFVRESRSFADVLRRIGRPPGGRAQARLKIKVAALGVDTSHFTGAGWRRGDNTPVVPAAPLDQYLVAGRLCQSSTLKRRLIESGLKRAQCERCSRTEWNGAPIPLELDHVNGRRDDNRIDNLRLLCPNCHAQTDTYRGRNIGKASGIL